MFYQGVYKAGERTTYTSYGNGERSAAAKRPDW